MLTVTIERGTGKVLKEYDDGQVNAEVDEWLAKFLARIIYEKEKDVKNIEKAS